MNNTNTMKGLLNVQTHNAKAMGWPTSLPPPVNVGPIPALLARCATRLSNIALDDDDHTEAARHYAEDVPALLSRLAELEGLLVRILAGDPGLEERLEAERFVALLGRGT